ncbi:MAG: hypothetical protein A3C35_03850 [Omnitrophica bacterium RIFCSPHIGHO2_02_FULL_46_11]|nr:MAG: hypothetical protein A3A81_00735 [Omnitrophica bacterium RIFCSPLOWO2_01_FULL_45_10b]OGW86003.1 MAG: hypothetical protein A3C35_03850 [Omnitrophica bacterium RIFCSPHIGHO2_02_FULL_46_11]
MNTVNVTIDRHADYGNAEGASEEDKIPPIDRLEKCGVLHDVINVYYRILLEHMQSQLSTGASKAISASHLRWKKTIVFHVFSFAVKNKSVRIKTQWRVWLSFLEKS